MTKAGKSRAVAAAAAQPGKFVMQLRQREGETKAQTLARTLIDPNARHASLSNVYAGQVFGDDPNLSITDTAALLELELGKAAGGDMTLASRILASQAVSLDAIFTELARRSAQNMGQYPEAMERYMRLSLKAQSASRTTLEALTKLHQPREQTVRHVHVNRGGQAVVADQFHHHAGGIENAESAEQSHATGSAG